MRGLKVVISGSDKIVSSQLTGDLSELTKELSRPQRRTFELLQKVYNSEPPNSFRKTLELKFCTKTQKYISYEDSGAGLLDTEDAFSFGCCISILINRLFG